jgi:hypothetical protein
VKSRLLAVAAAGVMMAATLAHGTEAKRRKAGESIAVVVSQARFEFERSHAELGLVGSAAPLEEAALAQAPVAPSVGLITGMPLPRPVARIATNAPVEAPFAAPAR